MLTVLLVTFPFFALVLAGYVAARRRWLPLDSIGGLNGFVLFFALPCMLFRFGARTPIADLLDPAVAAVYVTCALAVVAGAVARTRRRLGWNDAAFGAALAAGCGDLIVPVLQVDPANRLQLLDALGVLASLLALQQERSLAR